MYREVIHDPSFLFQCYSDPLQEAYKASVGRTARALRELVECHEAMVRLQRLAFEQFSGPPHTPGHIRVKAAAGLPVLALDPVSEGHIFTQPEREAFKSYAERWLKRAGEVTD